MKTEYLIIGVIVLVLFLGHNKKAGAVAAAQKPVVRVQQPTAGAVAVSLAQAAAPGVGKALGNFFSSIGTTSGSHNTDDVSDDSTDGGSSTNDNMVDESGVDVAAM